MMIRNLPKSLRTLVALRFLEACASGAMLPFVVLWAHRDAGLAGAAAGTLFIGQALGEFGGGVAGGGLADRYGHRRILLLSTAGMTLAYGLLTIAGAPWLAIVLFLVAGVFESAFHPTVGALVADRVPDDQLMSAFSVIRIGSNLGRIVGPLLGALAAVIALHAVFAVSGVLLAAAVLTELLFLSGDRRLEVADDEDEPEIPPGTLRALRTDRRLAVLVLAGGLIAITFAWFEADGLVVLRQQAALSTTAYAGLFTIAATVVVLAQLPLTRLLGSLPAGRALLFGATAQAAGIALLTAAHVGYGVLVVAVVVLALGESLYSPTVSTVVSRRARPNQRASYQAALSITEDIGTAVGPISGLAMARITTAAGLWILGAAACLVAGIGSTFAARGSGLSSPDTAARARDTPSAGSDAVQPIGQ